MISWLSNPLHACCEAGSVGLDEEAIALIKTNVEPVIAVENRNANDERLRDNNRLIIKTIRGKHKYISVAQELDDRLAATNMASKYDIGRTLRKPS